MYDKNKNLYLLSYVYIYGTPGATYSIIHIVKEYRIFLKCTCCASNLRYEFFLSDKEFIKIIMISQ